MYGVIAAGKGHAPRQRRRLAGAAASQKAAERSLQSRAEDRERNQVIECRNHGYPLPTKIEVKHRKQNDGHPEGSETAPFPKPQRADDGAGRQFAVDEEVGETGSQGRSHGGQRAERRILFESEEPGRPAVPGQKGTDERRQGEGRPVAIDRDAVELEEDG